MGKKGILIVDNVLRDFDGFLESITSINVIGNDVLEEEYREELIDSERDRNINTDTHKQNGILGKSEELVSLR